MSEEAKFPEPLPTDAEDVSWALSTGQAMWTRGDLQEAVRWVKRASDSAADAGDDDRAFALARAAADLKVVAGASVMPPPAAPVADAPKQEAAKPSQRGPASAVPPPPPPRSSTKVPPPPPRPSPSMSPPKAGPSSTASPASAPYPAPTAGQKPSPQSKRPVPNFARTRASAPPPKSAAPRSATPPPARASEKTEDFDSKTKVVATDPSLLRSNGSEAEDDRATRPGAVRPALPTPTEVFATVPKHDDEPPPTPRSVFPPRELAVSASPHFDHEDGPTVALTGEDNTLQGRIGDVVAQERSIAAKGRLTSYRVWILPTGEGARVVSSRSPRPEGAIEAVLVADGSDALDSVLD